jgi:hypothetical protein
MNIYQIDSQITAVIEASIDPETGELLDITEQLEALQMAREKKIENIALYRKNEAAMVADIAAEIKALTERKKRHEAAVERMDKLLGYATGGIKFESANCLVKFTSSVSTGIEDEASFISWAEANNAGLLTFAAPKPNKTEIKKALNDGQEIPYCSLKEHQNIQVK